MFLGGAFYQNSIQMRISTTTYGDAVRMDFCTVSTGNISTQETRMSIMPFTGNVGIGTTTPGQKLEVVGTVKFNDTLLINGNASLPATTDGLAYYTGGYGTPTAGRLVFGASSGWYYRFSTRSGGVTTDLVSIRDNGFVGIGTTVPTVPLDIAFSTSIATGSGYNWIGDGSSGPWNSSDNICLRARGTIWSERRLIIASDQRIKTNISSIDTNDSYNILQNLNPVSFDYIDKSGGPSKNIGFIAQEIEALLPNAISKQTNYIPNVYSFVSSSGTLFENSTILTFNYNLSSVFVSSPIKFYDNTNKEYLGKIVNVESTSFKIQTESIDVSKLQSTYFIYGTEVNDYLTIDKDAIFTINVNATKQLIKQVHTLQEKVDTYESRISTLEGLIIKQ